MQLLQPPRKALHLLAIDLTARGTILLLNAVVPVQSKPLLQVLVHVPRTELGCS